MNAVSVSSRLVEVIADLGAAGWRYGSGCIVAGRTVLTAAHVVAGAHEVWVRGPDKLRLPCHPVDPGFVGDPRDAARGPDLALVEINDASVDLPAMPLARVDRASTSGEVVDRCHAWGYPQFKQVYPDGPEGEPVRESCDAAGVVPLGSGLVFGLLDVQVLVAPRDLPPAKESLGNSPWSGISGGPVIAGGRLLGIISEHAPRAGSGSLTASPLTAISYDPEHPAWGPGVLNPSAWWDRLGVKGPDRLAVLPPPRQPPPYLATLRDMGRTLRARVLRLEGRDEELAAVERFATGTEGYRWLVGGAFSGKTSLMYHAVTATLPDTVDVVSYFLRRVASDADAEKFLLAVIPQLAALCEVDGPGIDEHSYRSLWEQAVARARDTGSHLLLVVDGLDEDLNPPNTASVASLLPDLVTGVDPSAAYAHVHVTSRPKPDLPADIRENTGHPLHHTPRTPLDGFPGWEEMRDLGTFEISRLVDAGGLARDVFGLFAAAAGPLSLRDLITLQHDRSADSSDEWGIEDLLIRETARSLERVGPAGWPRYQFAHGTLLEHAQAHPALNKPQYRQRLHGWADTWRDAGWPAADTPLYLLDTYPALLGTTVGDLLVGLYEDLAYLETAITVLGVARVQSDLHAAVRQAGAGELSALRNALEREAHRLRAEDPLDQTGYVTRQLCLQALQSGEDRLVAMAQERLHALPRPQLVPSWTTVRGSSALRRTLTKGWGKIVSVAITADGSRVASPDGQQVQVWNTATGELLHTLPCRGWVYAVAISADGTRVVAGGTDDYIRVWDTATGSQVDALRSGRLWALAIDANASRIVADAEGPARLWDTAAQTVQPLPMQFWPDALGISADGSRIIACRHEGRVAVWDLTINTIVEPMEDHTAWSVAISQDGSAAVSGDTEGNIHVWNAATGASINTIHAHSGRVSAVAANADGSLVISSDEHGNVQLQDPQTGTVLAGVSAHAGPVRAVAAASDGSVFVTAGEDGAVRLWNAGDRARRAVDSAGRAGPVKGLAISGNGSYVVSCGSDTTVRVWDHETGAPVRVLRGLTLPVQAVATSFDGSIIVAGGDHANVMIWQAGSELPQRLLTGHHSPLHAMAVDAAGSAVFAADREGQLLYWDLTTEKTTPSMLLQQRRRILALATTPDGSRLVIGDEGGTASLVNRDSAEVSELPVNYGALIWPSPVGAVAISPDASRMVIARENGRLQVWEGKNKPQRQREGFDLVQGVSPDGIHAVFDNDEHRLSVSLRGYEGLLSASIAAEVSAVAIGAIHDPSRGCLLVLGHRDGGLSGFDLLA